MKLAKVSRGVEWHRTTMGETVIYIKYESGGKLYREKIGPSERDEFKRDKTVEEARRRLKARREQIRSARLRGEVWIPPKEAARREAETVQAQATAREVEAEAATKAREALLFEKVVERFLAERAIAYADPVGARGLFNRLGLVFNGRHLDTIGRADVQRYIDDRLAARGAFAGYKRVNLRSPQTEIDKLSLLFGFLARYEDRNIANPCAGVWDIRAKMKGQSYAPERAKVIARTKEQREALFAAFVDPEHRALVVLQYHMAGRPEGETLQVRHGDVTLPTLREWNDHEKGRAIAFGRVEVRGRARGGTRKTKTAQSARTLPLHPTAAAALQAVMLARPADPEQLARWAETPIFRKVDRRDRTTRTDAPQDRHSYRKAWATALEAVVKQHPELAGMVLRDLRATAKTVMSEAGTPDQLTRKVLGHRRDVADDYLSPDLRAAILTLDGDRSFTEARQAVVNADAATSAAAVQK